MNSYTWRAGIIKSDLAPTTRHVLLTLSCHVNDAGESAYPSVELLAKETGLSRKSVITHLAKAKSAGWISVKRHGLAGSAWARHEYYPRFPNAEFDEPLDQSTPTYQSSREIRAQKLVQGAVKRGDLLKQPCRICGSTKVEAHHEDYHKPLEVVWLCKRHHRQIHKETVVNEVHRDRANRGERGSPRPDNRGEPDDQNVVNEVHPNYPGTTTTQPFVGEGGGVDTARAHEKPAVEEPPPLPAVDVETEVKRIESLHRRACGLASVPPVAVVRQILAKGIEPERIDDVYQLCGGDPPVWRQRNVVERLMAIRDGTEPKSAGRARVGGMSASERRYRENIEEMRAFAGGGEE